MMTDDSPSPDTLELEAAQAEALADALADALASALRGDRVPVAPERRERVWAAVQAKQAQALPASVPAATRSHLSQRLSRPVWFAGGLVAIAALIVAVRGVPTAAGDRVIVQRDYTTTTAQRARVELPDGSMVQLAPETQVRYSVTRRGDRRVTLRGEAYFTVTHDPARTFTVHTGTVATRVLGTAFDVRSYPGDTVVSIAVTDGRVGATAPRASTIVSAGMVARVTDSTATLDPSGDSHAATAWTTGKLVFEHAPVAAVLDAASRWSGYRFRLMDSTLARRAVSTVLPIDDPAQLLRALQDLLDVRSSTSGNVVTLYTRHATRAPDTPATRGVPKTWSTPKEVGR